MRFVALPAGQDPDDVVRTGGRPAFEALVAAAEPLVERLWRHEVDAAALDTPEARAGLRQRLLDHVSAIADPNVRSLYRDEWLRRFDALVRPQAAQRGAFTHGPQWKKGKDGRYTPPEAPPGSGMRAIGNVGIDRSTASALLTGFALFPEAAPAHVEALAHLPLADRAAAELRDRIVDCAMTGEPLDRAALHTILQGAGAEGLIASVQRAGAIGFSFTRSDADPERAVRDLGLALETLAATGEIDAALKEATRRLTGGDGEAFAEQQRLHAAREALNERLASLAGSD
jgi:DNA primase